MQTVIVGSGAVARALARRLDDQGHEIRFVAEHSEAAESLAEMFPRALVIRGSVGDENTLRQAGAAACDVLFAVDDDDMRNMVACVLAREEFAAGRIVALASQACDQPAFRSLSINTVSAPDTLAETLLGRL